MPRFDYRGISRTVRRDKKPAITNFYRYKLDVFRTIASVNSNLRDIIIESETKDYDCRAEDRDMFQVEFITNKPKGLITYFTFLKAGMMAYDVIHPVPVVKISITDKSKIGKGCYMLDNYIYSYIEGPDRDLVDLMISEGVITKVGEYEYSGQPPVLEYPIVEGKRIICSNFREELFEWIPENSNVIIEIRRASYLTRGKCNPVVTIGTLPEFIVLALTDLSDTFRYYFGIIINFSLYLKKKTFKYKCLLLKMNL